MTDITQYDDAFNQYEQLRGNAPPQKTQTQLDREAVAKALRDKNKSPFELYQQEQRDRATQRPKLPGTDTV